MGISIVKKSKQIFLWVFAGLCVWHFASLSVSPLPWFDEVFFADISNSLVEKNSFELTIAPQYFSGDVLIYGPVYFLAQYFPIKWFGLSQFSFRFLNLISGLLIVFIGFRQLKINFWIALIWLLSPLYIQNLHSGRMDLVSVLFCFIGYLPFLKGQSLGLKNALWISLWFSIAILTTPRVAFLFPGVYAFFIRDFINFSSDRRKLVFLSALPIASVVASFLLWSLFSTGSVFGIFEYILEDASTSSHIGLSFFRRHLEDAISLLLLITLLASVFRSRHEINLWVATINYVFFSLFVREVGPYGAMIIPFLLMGINTGIEQYRMVKLVSVLILLVFTGVFFLKSYVIFGSYAQRDWRGINHFIELNIDPGVTVVAPFVFYYGLKNNQNEFITYQISKVSEEESIRIMLDQQPAFVLIPPQDSSNSQVVKLLEQGNFNLVASYKPKRSITFSQLPFIGSRLKVTDGYDALLFSKSSIPLPLVK